MNFLSHRKGGGSKGSKDTQVMPLHVFLSNEVELFLIIMAEFIIIRKQTTLVVSETKEDYF